MVHSSGGHWNPGRGLKTQGIISFRMAELGGAGKFTMNESFCISQIENVGRIFPMST